MIDSASNAPGWYGKLPSTGDFASRRLPHELIEPWDHWLAEEIGELRQSRPDTWLAAYLDSPTWRFVLGAGVLGAAQALPLAGVLMPSVDRVGRYFPLTIMAPLSGLPHDTQQADRLLAWLHALDDLAADALQDDWPIDELESALARLSTPEWDRIDPAFGAPLNRLAQGEARLVELPLPVARADMAASLGAALWSWGLQCAPQGVLAKALAPGLSWWWCDPPGDDRPRRSLLARGLPSGDDFAQLLGSDDHTPMAFAGDLGDTAPSDHPAPDAR